MGEIETAEGKWDALLEQMQRKTELAKRREEQAQRIKRGMEGLTSLSDSENRIAVRDVDESRIICEGVEGDKSLRQSWIGDLVKQYKSGPSFRRDKFFGKWELCLALSDPVYSKLYTVSSFKKDIWEGNGDGEIRIFKGLVEQRKMPEPVYARISETPVEKFHEEARDILDLYHEGRKE